MSKKVPPEASVTRKENLALAIIIALGIFMRFSGYWANRSIWLDEACLALNVINKSFLDLIVHPLDDNQAAPVAFLLLTKLLVSTLGRNEYVLRLIPFLASLGSLVIFYKFLVKFASRKVALIALVLFSISIHLMRY